MGKYHTELYQGRQINRSKHHMTKRGQTNFVSQHSLAVFRIIEAFCE